MTPLSARKALDQYFQEARSKLLDLAAIFDRLDRGADAEQIRQDPRTRKLRQALEILQSAGPSRAEAVQLLFSLEYDPHWKRPQPR